jgi:hypothetical protein
MSDISDKHSLADGRSVWIQHTPIRWAAPTDPMWSVVITSLDPMEAPEIRRYLTKRECLETLADVLRDDVCDAL